MSEKTYCLHCKKKTKNKNDKIVTKNGYRMLKSLCAVCDTKKSEFIKNNTKQTGKGVVNKFISALPVKLHLKVTDPKTVLPVKSNFIGPGTNLLKRLEPGSNRPKAWNKPLNGLDRAAYKHDLAYRDHQDLKSRNQADARLSEAADRFLKSPESNTLTNKAFANIIKAVMSLIKRKEK